MANKLRRADICPCCQSQTEVVDKRMSRRRRKCNVCGFKYTTLEILKIDIEPKPQTEADEFRQMVEKCRKEI